MFVNKNITGLMLQHIRQIWSFYVHVFVYVNACLFKGTTFFFQETQSTAYVWTNMPPSMTYTDRIPHARRVTPAFCLDLPLFRLVLVITNADVTIPIIRKDGDDDKPTCTLTGTESTRRRWCKSSNAPLKSFWYEYLYCVTGVFDEQEAHGPQLAHLSKQLYKSLSMHFSFLVAMFLPIYQI